MLHVVEEHHSPDGVLTLKVGREEDGGCWIGFGYSWHTHGEILASLSGLREDEAVRKFVDDVIGGRAIIAVACVAGKIRDVWIAEEPIPDRYKQEDETIEFRYWDGGAVA
jgi:hypothetical protein